MYLVKNELNNKLLGRLALVTGGANGIGESIVCLFHKHGAEVCVADIQDELEQRVCESLGEEQDACFIHFDVTSEADVSHAVDFAELSVFDNVLDVNVKGVFLGIKHAARVMIPPKKGSIVSLGSVAGAIGGLGLMLIQLASLKHGIRVNCVSPYAVATGLGLSHFPHDQRNDDAIADFNSYFGQLANPEGVHLAARDVANAKLFLTIDEARYISGHNLMVDGGFSSLNHSLRVFK
ncbi:unnamed protein product [Withania somnifera]